MFLTELTSPYSLNTQREWHTSAWVQDCPVRVQLYPRTATTCRLFLYSIRLAVHRRSNIYPWWKYNLNIRDEKCPRLGYYGASSDNSLPKFLDNLSVPSSRKPLKSEPTSCPETSVINYHYSQRNSPEQRSPHLQLPQLSVIVRSQPAWKYDAAPPTAVICK